MTDAFNRIEQLEKQVGILSNWCAELHLALVAHGINVADNPPPKPHTFPLHATGSPLLMDTTMPEPVDRQAGHEIHYEGY